MENPWADPWNHSQKPAEEADLANPSWSTGTGIQWDEPSDFPSLWNNNSTDAAAAWIPPKSPYDDLPIGRTLSQSSVGPSDSPISESHDTIGFQTAPASPKQDSPATSLPPSPAPQLREPTPLASTRSTSPDGYGTFESADTDIGAGAWTSSATSFPSGETEGDNAWGDAWAPAPDPPEDEEPQLDEWEVAKLQKEKQDQHVPPELLASIVQQLKELSDDLWPESLLDQGETRQPSKDFMADVPNLASAVEMFVPKDLVLPPHVQLAKTFTLKHMNEALRLTKHLPMTLSSPLAIYLASKGSTAWEASLKSKHDIHPDDVLPPGWRMVEKDKYETSPVPEVKKKAGGLLSFLGLKGSDGSTESTSQKLSPSSSRPTSIVGSVKSPKSSMDGSSKPTSEHRSSISQSTTMTSPAPTSSASVPLPVGDQKTPQEVAPQPSAVSRFLGRFSRSSAASSQASGSQSQSIALSSDDIEFLSDIVPSANDDADAEEDMKSLTTPITTKPLRVSSLPQPLPPPPKPPSLLPPPPLGASTRMQDSATKHPEVDDPFSLFDSEQPLTSKESKSIQSLVPLGSVRQALSAPNSSKLPNTASFHPLVRPTTPLPVTIMAPSPRAHTPTITPAIPSYSQRRNVTAIMSDSGRPTGSNLQAPLPPAPLPPPPASPGPLAHPSMASLQAQQPTSLFDDDEFSDFMSSPATTAFPPQPTSSTTVSNRTTSSTTVSDMIDTSFSITSFSSALSNQSLLHSSSSDFVLDGFASSTSAKSGLGLLDGDFADFISSPTSALPTPSPPRPPSKPPTFAAAKPLSSLSMGLTMNQEPLPLPPPPTRHDHSRVANLVESAAARPGRWPATTPPLPHPIAPPPSSSSAGKTSLNIFGNLAAPSPKPLQTPTSMTSNNNTLRKNLAVRAANMTPPPPLRAMSPPLTPTQVNGNSTNSPVPQSFGVNGIKTPLTPSTPRTTTGSCQKAGGLSAQDLSFFEGL